MNIHPSKILLNTAPNLYLFNNVEVEERGEVLYCPIEVDCEYQQHSSEMRKGDYFFQKTITTQWRHIHAEEGVILGHKDIGNLARHDLGESTFPLGTYLEKLGLRNELVYRFNQSEITRTIHFHLYTFFAIAELFRIFGGTLLEEISDLTRSTKGFKISQGRRVIAESAGGKYTPYVELRHHALRLGKHLLRIRLSIWDTCAVQGATNYATFCKNSGVDLKYKDLFTPEEKGQMIRMYVQRPDDFDNYALGDLYNYQALEGNTKMFADIYKSLQIDNFEDIPKMTIGATVANMIKRCLQNKFNIAELDYLDSLVVNSTAKTFLDNTTSTSVFLAKVDGGRCRNNRPKDVVCKNPVADIDISGCYGEGLRNQLFPVGRPFIIDYPVKSAINEYLTLGQFLKKYGDELVPGLWKARISTPEGCLLEHRQDFIISWFPPKDLNKLRTDNRVIEYDAWWTEDNVGETKILTHEVNLGVVNHDTVDWINNVCGKQQRSELLDKLLVVTAMFYPKSERVKDVSCLQSLTKSSKSKNTTTRVRKSKVSIQSECHAWCAVGFDELIVDVLLRERKKHPKKTPLNELYKLCINTIYGDMVSPYFTIGNVCVGDNITARARAMAWYMEKGLNGFQTITDGCAFELNRVVFKNERDITAQSFVPMNHKGEFYKYAPLGGYSWKVESWGENGAVMKFDSKNLEPSDSLKLIDELAGEHLRSLFPEVDVLHKVTTDVYGNERIGMFSFETKGVYAGAAFHGTANYSFYNTSGSPVAHKMRSYRKHGQRMIDLMDSGLEVVDPFAHPSQEFLDRLYQNPKGVARSKPFIHTSILKLGVYNASYTSKFKNSPMHPGCNFEVARLLRECSLTMFTFQTREQQLTWDREACYMREHLYQTYEGVYTNEDTGLLNYLSMVNDIDTAIAQGKRSLLETGKRARRSVLAHGVGKHPAHATLDSLRERLSAFYRFEQERWFQDDDFS